jgi:hypothetical protein
VDILAGHHGLCPLNLLVVLEEEAPLHLSAEALQGSGSEDAFGCPARTEEEVDAGLLVAGSDGGVHVAVLDEADAGAGGAHLTDDILVTGAVEDDDEIVEKEPIALPAPAAKKGPYPAGSTEDDTPPMAYERKMLGGQKVKMSKKPWPAHCWSQSSGDYLGVWDDAKKEFDTNYDDPCAE